MTGIFKERLHQGYRTLDYPGAEPAISDRYPGRPRVAARDCGDCAACLAVCPTKAVTPSANGPILDMGRCLFCGRCAAACPGKSIVFSHDHRVAVLDRDDLVVTAGNQDRPRTVRPKGPFSRSLKIREVSAGGCNACEADTNVLGTLAYDLGKFGIGFVASPRHADAIVVTGPVPTNMRAALLDTYAAMPAPKLVVAVGTCAISGGLFGDGGDECRGVPALLPVDAFIPGCPPNPWSILDGLLAVSGRLA